MATQAGVEVPSEVLDYLQLHHIITIATASFTGMPHAATTAYVSDRSGVYFSMQPEEVTVRNIDANHFASFTIDDYTPDFRKVRELRGVGRSGPVSTPDQVDGVLGLFSEKLPNMPREALGNILHVRPLELHFVDFEYTAGVAVPMESSIVYQAAPETTATTTSALSTQLEALSFDPGQVIVRQGERSERFFIIVRGEVEVRREGHGQDVVVTRHAQGQFFGEAGALTGAPQSATFIAVKPTTVLAVDRSALQDFVAQSAVADLGQRVRATLDDLGRGGQGG